MVNKMNYVMTEYYEHTVHSTFLCMRRAIRESPTLGIVPDDSQGTRKVIKISVVT